MLTAKIVILNWNGARLLRRFLPDVVAAAPPHVQVVVADNGSADESVALLETDFPTVQVIRLDRNYGFAGGYNRALAQLDADVFVLLNSDVQTPRGWLDPLLQVLEEEPDIAAVSPKLLDCTHPDRFEYAGASGGFIDYLGYIFCRGRILRTVEQDRGQYDDRRDVFWVSGAAFCCRASVFREAGGFDDDFFAHQEEIDLCWRMQLAGYRIQIVPQSTVYHLGGGTLRTGSPAKTFYNHRNNISMLCKCAPTAQWIAVLLLRPPLDAFAALTYLLQGNWKMFSSVLRAYRDLWRRRTVLTAQRRKIRNGLQRESTQIYKGPILLRYLLGHRHFDNLMQ